MWYYDDGLDYRNPADRENIEKQKRLEREERIKYIKAQRRSYLKGKRGVRLYYDRDYFEELLNKYQTLDSDIKSGSLQ